MASANTTVCSVDRDAQFTQNPIPVRIQLGPAPVDVLTMQAAGQWVLQQLVKKVPGSTKRPLQIMGPNAFLVTLAATNRRFAAALAGASLCLADGMSIVWATRLLGAHIHERVPGGEFMEHLCALCAQHGLSVYFLGGLPGAAEGAAAALSVRYPGLVVAGTDCPPMHFERDDQQNLLVRSRIARARPDLLFVALGAPRQEIWIAEECPSLPIGAALSVGAAFDTQAGLRKRAPAWTHNIGLEWAYRFAQEPRRLWKRYLIGNMHFLCIALAAWWKQQQQAAAGPIPPKHPQTQIDSLGIVLEIFVSTGEQALCVPCHAAIKQQASIDSNPSAHPPC
jgi:N-acetylglucosaminyldiphosphoundecaprenol N-acetyl-beta-D-mannosaminyltransferase